MTTSKPLVVPSVQELIKKPIITIPDEYVVQADSDRHHQDNPIIPEATIPIIDFNLLLSNDTPNLELEKLHSSCKEWGIFQLVNHGVELEKVKEEVGGFYKLPIEERIKYKIRGGEVEGYGTLAKLSKGKLDWGDRFYIITNPISRRRPHLLPQLPSSLRNNLENYIMELQKLGKLLLGFIAKGLKMDEKEMEEKYEDGMESIRMTYYPACPKPDQVIGLTPHSDASGITILNQITAGVDGLEVFKDGVWFPVTFLPGSLVVNVGDILEIMSNGEYHSIEHKARVNREKERISIAFFVNPRFDAVVGPATSLINPLNPPIFRSIAMENYVQDYFSRNIKGKSYLDYMKIN